MPSISSVSSHRTMSALVRPAPLLNQLFVKIPSVSKVFPKGKKNQRSKSVFVPAFSFSPASKSNSFLNYLLQTSRANQENLRFFRYPKTASLSSGKNLNVTVAKKSLATGLNTDSPGTVPGRRVTRSGSRTGSSPSGVC